MSRYVVSKCDTDGTTTCLGHVDSLRDWWVPFKNSLPADVGASTRYAYSFSRVPKLRLSMIGRDMRTSTIDIVTLYAMNTMRIRKRY